MYIVSYGYIRTQHSENNDNNKHVSVFSRFRLLLALNLVFDAKDKFINKCKLYI